MPLTNAAWECLRTMSPKSPKHVGPIERRLGSVKSLDELIAFRHLKRSGAMVVRTAASVDAFSVFDCLPDDGASRGNTTLKSAAGLTDRRYEAATKLLLRSGEVAPAGGAGGALRRAGDGPRAGAVKQESNLYEPFKKWLESGDKPSDQILRLCLVTATGEGHRRGRGAWARPDVVVISVSSVTAWEFVPGVVAEIHSYELKPYREAEKLPGVYEACAHQRRAHYSTLVLEWPPDGDRKVPAEIEDECSRLGVGLAFMWGSKVTRQLEPRRNSPAPDKLQEFLQDALSRDEDRTAYLQAIGRVVAVDAE